MYNLWFIFGILLAMGICGTINIIKKVGNWGWYELGAPITAVCGFIGSIIVLGCCIYNPLEAQKQVTQFENMREIVVFSVENGNSYDNFAITQKIIDANTWLAEAKAEKHIYGNWSMYYNIDFNTIELIQIPE